jgi:hypothetical protein
VPGVNDETGDGLGFAVAVEVGVATADDSAPLPTQKPPAPTAIATTAVAAQKPAETSWGLLQAKVGQTHG